MGEFSFHVVPHFSPSAPSFSYPTPIPSAYIHVQLFPSASPSSSFPVLIISSLCYISPWVALEHTESLQPQLPLASLQQAGACLPRQLPISLSPACQGAAGTGIGTRMGTGWDGVGWDFSAPCHCRGDTVAESAAVSVHHLRYALGVLRGKPQQRLCRWSDYKPKIKRSFPNRDDQG